MVNIVQGDFSGGEVTPRVAGKIGKDRHHASLGKVFNWMITPQGSMITRQGTILMDDSLNNDRYKAIFTFPSSKSSLVDEVIEIDSNGLTGVEHRGNIYSWNGSVRTVLTATVPEEFGDLSTMRSEWDVSTSSLILASEVHEPYRLRYDGTDFLLGKLYTTLPPEWIPLSGYPNALTFFQNRLWFGGSSGYPNHLWATEVGNIDEITSDNSLNMKPLLEGYIQWILSSSRRITIGTSISEYSLDSTDGSGLTEANARILRTSNHGSSDVQAVPINEQVMFVSSGGSKLLASNYVRDEDNWLASEISNPAQHMFRRPFEGIAKIVSSPNPDSTIWILRLDGMVACCTYDRQSQVNAWSLLDFGAPVIDLTSVKTIRGNYLYMLVARTNIGAMPTSTSMEILTPMREQWFRADCNLRAKFSIEENVQYASGLERFEGNEVDVASVFGSLALKETVVGGRVRINGGDSDMEIWAGLTVDNKVLTLKPSLGQTKDTLIGSKISIANTTILMFDSISPHVNDQVPNDVYTEDIMAGNHKDFGYSSLRREARRNEIFEANYDIVGYDDHGILEISTKEPYICEITGVSSEVTSNRT